MKKLLFFLMIAGVFLLTWKFDLWEGIQEEVTERVAGVTTLIENRENFGVPASTDPIEGFFFMQLDDEAQTIYRLIRDGLAASELEITILNENTDLIHDIFQRVLFDHPEFFWVTGASSTSITSRAGGQFLYATFMPVYGHTGEGKTAMKEAIEVQISNFLAAIDPSMTDYEKVRAVYEHLIRQTAYNLEAPDHQNIASVFLNGESVCAGISKAAQLLLGRLGIFATYVTGEAYIPGTSSQPIPHAWNLVQVGGEYYYLDVTWGMPIFGEDSPLEGRIDVIYDYLLLTGEMLYRTHTLAPGILMPEVTSFTHTFFHLNGMFFEEADPFAVRIALNESVLNKEERTSFQFASQELFWEMRELLLTELAPEAARNLMEWHGLSSTQYAFREKENLNKITFYWQYD